MCRCVCVCVGTLVFMSVSNRVGCPVAGPEPDTFTDELCPPLPVSPPHPLALPAQAYMDKLTVILLYTHIFLSSFSVVTRFFPCTVPVRFVKSLMARRAGIDSRTDRGAAGGRDGERGRGTDCSKEKVKILLLWLFLCCCC